MSQLPIWLIINIDKLVVLERFVTLVANKAFLVPRGAKGLNSSAYHPLSICTFKVEYQTKGLTTQRLATLGTLLCSLLVLSLHLFFFLSNGFLFLLGILYLVDLGIPYSIFEVVEKSIIIVSTKGYVAIN